jgi:hypothetical protein
MSRETERIVLRGPDGGTVTFIQAKGSPPPMATFGGVPGMLVTGKEALRKAAPRKPAPRKASHRLNVAAEVGTVLRRVLMPLHAKLAELQKHRDEYLQFAGEWTTRKLYKKGNLVHCAGGLWVCLKTGKALEPGTDPAAWRLAVKGSK